MARLLYVLICTGAMAALMWGLHELVYQTSADFSTGLTVGCVGTALLFGAYLKLRYNE